MNFRWPFRALVCSVPRTCSSILVLMARDGIAGGGHTLRPLATGLLPAAFLLASTGDQVYNLLWTLVFGFATLNILSLGARRFDARKTGLNFGEVIAIAVVIVSVLMLGWEMLYVLHILPIRLSPR